MNKFRKGDVLYRRKSGSTIRYASGEGESIRAYIVGPNGEEYGEKSLDALLARGYWESVDEPEPSFFDRMSDPSGLKIIK
jgi:hypothetical protein